MRARTFVFAFFTLASALGALAQASPPTSFDSLLVDATKNPPGFKRIEDLLLAYMASEHTLTAAAQQVNEVRTDVQSGTSSTHGSTTLTELPGFADILSLAVERGAVTESTADGSLTLGTTPYAFWTAFGGNDNPANWERYRALRKLALSATFATTSIKNESDFETIQSGEIKYAVFGNRSPRDIAISTMSQGPVAEILKKADSDFDNTCGRQVLNASPKAFIKAEQQLGDWLKGAKNSTQQSVTQAVADAAKNIQLSQDQQAALGDCAQAMLSQASASVSAAKKLKSLADAYLEQNGKHQLSVAGSYQRDAKVSDYSTLKILYANNPDASRSTNFNASIDVNHERHDSSSAAIKRIRNYAAEFGVTRARPMEKDMDLSLSAKLNRDNDSGKSVVLVQGKMDLRFQGGVKLPLSLTYATKATSTIQKGFHFSVGMGALMDDFMSKMMK
jgi:hypothetical protein